MATDLLAIINIIGTSNITTERISKLTARLSKQMNNI
jgi:hypothetical protein